MYFILLSPFACQWSYRLRTKLQMQCALSSLTGSQPIRKRSERIRIVFCLCYFCSPCFSSLFSKLDIETDTTSWADPDMTNCSPLVTISDLDNITITAGERISHTHTHSLVHFRCLEFFLKRNNCNFRNTICKSSWNKTFFLFCFLFNLPCK